MARRSYSEAQAISFEVLHNILKANAGNMAASLAALRVCDDGSLRHMKWGMQTLADIVESGYYQDWKKDYMAVLASHAELMAAQSLADSSQLTAHQQAQLAQNTLQKQKPTVRKRASVLPDVPTQHTETASLIGALDE